MPIAPRLSRSSLYWLCSTLAGATLCILVYLFTQIVLSFYSYSTDQYQAWQMEERFQANLQASLVQVDVVDDLIKGECTLAAAVARLRHARAQDLGLDDRTLSRRLLNLVEVRLRDRPYERAEVLGRLRSELPMIDN